MKEAWKQWQGQTVQGLFDRYEIGAPLGASEEGAVFLTGRGAQRNLKAAIKLIPASEARAEQWLERWKTAEKLEHPHLLAIFDQGRARLGEVDLVFLVMEFADEDLSQILPERPLTPAETVEMLRPVLDALTVLHRQGLVHCHIKPSNIMAVGNRVKLPVDGLCRAGAPEEPAAVAGAYRSPEYASGPIGAAEDVWALGMTLVEVLTQKLPVRDPANENENDPVIPPTLPSPFFDIARQCLRRDLKLRCTVADIVARLQPPATPVRPQQPAAAGKRTVLAPLAVSALVVAALAGGWQWVQSRSDDHGGVTAATREQKAEPSPKIAVSSTHDESQAPAAGRPSPAHPASRVRPAVEPVATPEREVAGDGHNGVVREVIPEASQKAMDTIHGTIVVKVRVDVDPSGNVTNAEIESAGNSRYFPRLALEAARSWKFLPGQEGRARAWQIQFRFTSNEAAASASRVST